MKRMTRLLLIHWHYFVHEVIEFETINFLTGKNAAGKSTIMDALQLILLCDTSGSYFNKAASGRGTRTLNGYLRGELGDDEGSGFKYLRSGRFTSYIALEFYDEEKKTQFTAGCCFDSYSENDIQRLFFRYNGPLPEHEFIRDNKPIDIMALRIFLKENYMGHRYTTDVNRDFRQDLYGKLGGLQDRFSQLLRKAVSFNPNVQIQQFITEFVCDSQQIVDVSLMQENIHSYKGLEREADVLKQKIKHLEEIVENHQQYETYRKSEMLYSYLLDRAKLELNLEALMQEQQKTEELSGNLAILMANIKAAEEQRELLQQDRDLAQVQFANNEQAQILERLKNQIIERQQQMTSLQEQFEKQVSLLQRSIASWLTGTNAMIRGIGKIKLSTLDPLLVERIQALAEEGRQLHTQLDSLRQINASIILHEKESGLNRLARTTDDLRVNARELTSRLTEEQQKLAKNRKELQEELEWLKKGTYRFPQDALDLKEAVSSRLRIVAAGEAVDVVIVAEAAEISNPRWRNAIEGYLHTQKFYLIVPPEYVGIAIDIYDKIKRKNSLYKTGVVDTQALHRKSPTPQPGSLSEELETKNSHVRIYLDYVLGHVIKCDRVEKIRDNRTSITDEGLLYQNFVVSAIHPKRWTKPALGRGAIRQRLEDVKQEIAEISVLITACAGIKAALPTGDDWQTLSQTDIEQIVASARDMEQIPSLEIKIMQLKESMATVDSSVVNVLKQHIQEMDAKLKTLHGQISDLHQQKGDLGRSLQDSQQMRIPALEVECSNMESQLANDYDSDWVANTGCPRYQKELLTRGSAADIDRAFPRELSRSTNSKTEAWGKLRELRRLFNEKYIMGYDTQTESNEEYDNTWLELSEIKLPDYISRIEDARSKAFEQFQEDFLSRLQNNIRDVKRQIDSLNDAIKDAPFGEDTYRFRMIPNPEYKRYYDMIMDSMLLDGGYDLLSGQFNEKYRNEITDLFAIITNDTISNNTHDREDYEKRVQTYTDYRTYLSFDLEVIDSEGGSQRLSKTMGKKSGGETQTPFYVAVLASFAQLYRIGREKNASTARIILLDEAFSKMDGERIVRSMELLRKFQFQAVLSAPPDKIADIATLVDRNLCVLRNGKNVCVRSFDPRKCDIDEIA